MTGPRFRSGPTSTVLPFALSGGILIDHMQPALSAMTPQRIATESFTDADAAVDRLIGIYERNTGFLRDRFEAYVNGEARSTRVRATYPFVREA